MAWSATDNFDSYTAGATLDGGSGGSGWSTNWAGTATNECLVQNAPTGMSGKAAQIIWVSGDGGEAVRTFSSITDGIVQFQMQAAQTNKDGRFSLGVSGASRCLVRFRSTGQISMAAGATETDLQAYSANTTYTIKIKFGHVSGKFAVSIDGGAYSADLSMNGGNDVSLLALTNENTAGSTFYYDAIQSSVSGPANVKTVNGLAIASVKTINGLAIGSVKTIDGLA